MKCYQVVWIKVGEMAYNNKCLYSTPHYSLNTEQEVREAMDKAKANGIDVQQYFADQGYGVDDFSGFIHVFDTSEVISRFLDTSQFDFQAAKDYFTDDRKGAVEYGNHTVSVGICGCSANTVKREKARMKKDRKCKSPFKNFLGGECWLPHFIWDENEDSCLNENMVAQLAALTVFSKKFVPIAFNDSDLCGLYSLSGYKALTFALLDLNGDPLSSHLDAQNDNQPGYAHYANFCKTYEDMEHILFIGYS